MANIPRHRATAICYHDDVLDELLAPIDAQIRAAPPVTPIAEAVVPMVEVSVDTAYAGSTSASTVETAPTTEPVAETTCVTPPETEIRSAADALDALAAGLAATPIIQTPAMAVASSSADAPPDATAAGEYTDHLTPAAAAAAAVAEVIAANTAASDAINKTADGAAGPGSTGVVTSAGAPAFDLDVILDGATECAVTSCPASPIAPDPASGIAVVAALPPTPVRSPEPVAPGSASFEDTVAGMLRPLLREWLNANMPRMVEKALQQEMTQASASPRHQMVSTASDAA